MRIKILSIGLIASLVFSVAAQADMCPNPEDIKAACTDNKCSFTASGGWGYEPDKDKQITENTLGRLKNNMFQFDRVELLTRFGKQPPIKCIYSKKDPNSASFFNIYLSRQQEIVAAAAKGERWKKRNEMQYTCKSINVADCPFVFTEREN